MATMTETLTREISKADVERFLYGKHITACPACGRFRSQCDLEVHSISCQRAQATSLQTASTPVDVLMVVCQRSEEHTSELQSHKLISYAVFCLKKKKNHNRHEHHIS